MRIASAALLTILLAACSSGSANGKGQQTASPEAAPPEPAKDEPAAKAAADDERRGLVRNEPLPKLAAKVMRKQMGRHAQRMEGLQWSALMLNYETTKGISSSIVDEPRIARPTGDADTINQIIPAAFYDLQDELHAAAGDLAKASEAKNDQSMIQAYSRLTKTCIACHSLYLKIPGARPAQ